MSKRSFYRYLFLGFIVIALDRISKFYVLHYQPNFVEFNQFISSHLTMNRGISWGMFHSDNPFVFWLVTFVILATIGVIGFYTYIRWKHNKVIIAETLVLAGAISNLVDRFIYGGVIDFIQLSYGIWHWPIFNIADMSIVIGVLFMFIISLREK